MNLQVRPKKYGIFVFFPLSSLDKQKTQKTHMLRMRKT